MTITYEEQTWNEHEEDLDWYTKQVDGSHLPTRKAIISDGNRRKDLAYDMEQEVFK